MADTQSTARDIDLLLHKHPIAVIGMASIFPGARNLAQYWDNIVHEIDCITAVPKDRWEVSHYYDPDPTAPDKTYSRVGGFLPDIDFNPMEFGLPPNILEVTDVSQLLALAVARDALEDAGYGNGADRSATGITLGVGGGQKLYLPLTSRLQYPVWKEVLVKSGLSGAEADAIVDRIKKAYIPWEENSFPGMLGNVIAGRVANRLDLGGINCVLDAACGGSLAAMKMAVSELAERRSDMMITGGVDTDNSPFMYLCFSKTPAMSKKEFCSPFDEGSDGILIGEGVGMVILKRLDDAQRDKDRIYAVIKGVGTSSDGKFKSIYAPRPEGQARALERAYEDAGFSPATLGLMEAHATGTAAGDLAEFTSLKSVFSKGNPQKQHIAIGSVKSQIGHTKSAAGAAGFIKAALALHHKVLPPTLHVQKPNPKLGMEDSPFYVNTMSRPWIRHNGTPRRAAVSAFGFGGTNFHFVLEEAPAAPETAYRLHRACRSVVLDAPDAAALKAACEKALDGLDSDEAFDAWVRSLASRKIPSHHPRVGFAAKSASQARDLLQKAVDSLEANKEAGEWSLPQGVFFRKEALAPGSKTAALFSGQGSQYPNMGRDLALNYPGLVQAFDAMDKVFSQNGEGPLSEKVFPRPGFDPHQAKAHEEALRDTRFAQPAIGAFSLGLFTLLKQAGFSPDFTAGHSFGELSALWAAGVLSDQDFATLAHARGKAMAAPGAPGFDPGAMLAVMGDAEAVRKAVDTLENIAVANINSRSQVVCAGPTEAIQAARKTLEEAGFKTAPLKVSAAFHTSLVGHAAKPFAKALAEASFEKPRIPVFSNATAGPYPQDPEAVRAMLGEHILNPVRFCEEIENLYEAGARVFVECGPKNVLTKLVQNILQGKPHLAVALDSGAGQGDMDFARAMACLQTAGVLENSADAHQRILPEKAVKNPLNVKLNGSNYVSAKTRKAYEDALNGGVIVKRTMPQPPQAHAQEALAPAVPVRSPEPVPQAAAAAPAPSVLQGREAPVPVSVTLSSVENAINRMFDLQGQTLSAHGQYLENHRIYTQAFARLMESQTALLSPEGLRDIPENLHRSMEMFHAHHGDTLRLHEKYLDGQTQDARQALGLVGSRMGAADGFATAPAPPVPAVLPKCAASRPAPPRMLALVKEGQAPAAAPAPKPAPMQAKPAALAAPPAAAPASSGLDMESLANFLLETVSAKTGYPASMLELSMDMEADLGIDSIKRVEILGAMMDHYPGLPEISPDELAELRTLQQVVDRLEKSLGTVAPKASPAPSAPVVAVTAPASSGLDMESLSAFLLETVSAKTGYPASMLELSMDMEADLGIDSIKRVEILGAMMDQYPELPEISPDELAELRTLQQVVDRLEKSLGTAASVAAPAAAEVETVSFPASSALDMEALSAFLLETVSAKTGYPASMLELSMDMEADLGIDSIKRVEILGAMMDQYPELPEISPDELAELRTLQQVVDKLDRAIAPAPVDPLPEAPAALDPDPVFAEVERGGAVLKTIPPADRLHSVFARDGVCVIVHDGGEVAGELSRILARHQVRTVVLSPPWAPIDKHLQGLSQASLEKITEPDIRDAVAGIAREFGPIHGYVHLAPAGEEHARQSLELAFFAAKHLKTHLTEKTPGCRKFFVAAARMDGSLGMGKDDFCPVHGGLMGLAKTLGLEWEHVFCRGVDLSPILDLKACAKALAGEIQDPDARIRETGISREGRATLVPGQLPAPSARFKQGGGVPVFLVSGGAKGVTAKCVEQLAAECQGRFILLGRSSLVENEPAWAKGCPDEPALKKKAMEHLASQSEKPTPKKVQAMVRTLLSSREIGAALESVAKAGGEARYFSVDVTDAAQLKTLLEPVTREWGPVTGVIHGAGVLADKFIEDKSPADFEAVYSTKVDGLAALMSCVNPDGLQHLALFSSAAGFYGNPGQSDYAAANEVLNKTALAFTRRHPGCKVVSFNWGPWDGGMVTPELKRMFQAKKVAVIPLEEGAAIFVQELLSGRAPQVLVGSSMQVPAAVDSNDLQTHRVSRCLTLEGNPFLPDHVIGDWAVLPTVCVMGWMAGACEQFFPGFSFFRCQDYKMFKGIVFDKTLAEAYTLEARELSKDARRVELEVSIFSGKAGNRMPHYGSRIVLLSSPAQGLVYDRFDLSLEQAEDGGVFYQDGTLFHGPDFQVVRQVLNLGPEKLTLKAMAPNLTPKRQGQFPVGTFDPFAADVHFQSQLIWVRRHCEAGSLPARANTVEQYRPLKPGQEFFVSLDVVQSTPSSMVADICAHDAHGNVYTRVLGAEVTVSKRLTQLFAIAV